MKNSRSPHLLRLLGILAGLLLAGAPGLLAGDDWQPVTQEDLKMTSAQAGNADAIILYHEFSSDDARKHRVEYKRIKILTEKGKRYADVEIYYSQEGHFDTKVVEIKARTISPDGKIIPFSGGVFDKTVIQGHGRKLQAKTFTFPDVQVGSIIEWRYSEIWTDDYVLPARWILQEDLAQKRVKYFYAPVDPQGNHVIDIGHGDTADGVYHLDIGLPKGVSIKNPRPEIMQLDMTDVPAYEEEEFSPPSEMMKMRVYFYYGSTKMLKPVDFWKQQGNYWNKEVEKFMGHSSAVAQAAQQAVGDAGTPEEKVRKLYALVQKMNNLSYQDRSILEVMADERKSGATAEQILQQKGGSHDDLTRLFVAMVRSLNIPAYLMRVATREDEFFQQNMPEWSQLNSELAIVSLAEGKEIFLDPGAHLCPFGLLEWKRTSTQGIRQRSGGATELAQTPGPTYQDAITQRVANLKLEHDGSLQGQIALVWQGQQALQRRIEGAQTDEAGRRKAAEDELKSLLQSAAEVKLTSFTDWDDPEKPLKALFNVQLLGYAQITGKRVLLPSDIFHSKQLFVSEVRKTPVYFDYPYRVFDRVVINLPADLHLENLPQGQAVNADYAVCSVQRTLTGNVLELRRDFALGGYAFAAADYPKLKSFFEQVHANDDQQVTLQITPVTASQ